MHSSLSPDPRKMTKLVREILGGKPLMSIPPSQLPAVETALEESKSTYIKRGQVDRLKKVQSVLSDIQKMQQKGKSVHIKTPQTPSKPPEVVLQSVLSDLMDGFPDSVAETYLLPHLVSYSKSIIDDLIKEGKYAEAQKYENINKRLVALIQERSVEESKQAKMDTLAKQYATTLESLADAERRFERKKEEHEERSRRALEALENEWIQQERDFDAVTDGPLPLNYRKLSQHLLNLRETEKFLVKSRRFDEAADIKEEADQLEAQELIQLEQKFVQMRMAQKSVLIEQHNQKVKCLQLKNQRVLTKIVNEGEREIENLKRTIMHLESKIQGEPASTPIKERSETSLKSVSGGRLKSTRAGRAEIKRPYSERKRI